MVSEEFGRMVEEGKADFGAHVIPLQNIRPVVATILTRALSRRTMEKPGSRGGI